VLWFLISARKYTSIQIITLQYAAKAANRGSTIDLFLGKEGQPSIKVPKTHLSPGKPISLLSSSVASSMLLLHIIAVF